MFFVKIIKSQELMYTQSDFVPFEWPIIIEVDVELFTLRNKLYTVKTRNNRKFNWARYRRKNDLWF